MKKVDIVVPIYNAYEFTKKCIETIIENTDLKEHNLVLINDKSPDEKILPMLKNFKENYKDLNIIVLENEENCGFVKTVNKGMSFSKNDVILLNSDTEVTPNWINKLRDVAYSKENVATVTPLSNNATLASIPNFLEENNLPSFISLEEYSKAIEECSFNEYPEISTAHGFCMYIKREAIDKVGLFDDITFEKGYGEENDFSYRCINSGFINLMCDNTFIYHKGTQSFSEEKTKFIESHLKILEERYPENYADTNKLVNENPFAYIQDNIKYYINNKYKKNILMVVHAFARRNGKLIGGTARHIYDLIDSLRNYFNIHVFYKDDDEEYKLESFFEDSTAIVSLGKINSFEKINLYNNEYKKIVEKIFKIVNVDIVHIHHLKNHYFDIIDVSKKRHKTCIFTAHDYYMVCPTIVLLENNENSCVDNPNCDCEKCLKKVMNIDSNLIEKWRNLAYNTLSKMDLIIAPSNSTKEIFNKYYKDLDIKVIEHGIDYNNFEISENKSDKKNIAFLGGINKSKGIDFLREFVKKANNNEIKFNIHLFGGTSDDYLNKSSNNYYFHGLYDKEKIIDLLKDNNIDLVCLFSIWPETYSYTLTEAVLAGIPVISLDNGALGERIKKDDLGWVLDKNSKIEDILEKINDILERSNEKEYNNKLENIQKYVKNIKSVFENSSEYKKIYQKFIDENNLKEEFKMADKEFLKEIFKLNKISLKLKKLNEDKAYNNERIAEYDKTVRLLREEIDRLNKKIENISKDEEKYNKILTSRRIKFLKKIKFIKY